MSKTIKTVIFDLGGVLIGWKPVNIYIKAFNGDVEKAQWFIDNICTLAWNEEQDAGRTIKEGTAKKIKEFPEHEALILKYYNEWEDMLTGPIQETVDILQELKDKKQYKLFAITNWSAELFPIALKRYKFLQYFEDIVVSGEIKIRKPNPEIYQYSLKRFKIKASEAIFIDDNLRNVKAAEKEQINSIHYLNAAQLKTALKSYNIKV